MPMSILYWVLMIIWLIFGMWAGYTPGQPYPYRSWGGNLLIFILMGILGYKVFGGPIQ